MTKGNEKSAVEAFLKERREEDEKRSVTSVDFPKIRKELKSILKERDSHNELDQTELLELLAVKNPYISKCFPTLFSAAATYKPERIEEFKEMAAVTLDKLQELQEGKISTSKCSSVLLDDTYGKRFYKKKNLVIF